MTYYKISINNNALRLIELGQKKIEGRIKRGIFKNIHIGDKIHFYNKKTEILTKVIDIVEYNNILNYLSSENLSHIRPNKSKNEILDIYKTFYPNILEESNRILAIKISID